MSAALVALTVSVPTVFGAVYKPVDETVPAVADHITAVFVVPVTVAENCLLLPGVIEVLVGVIEIDTDALVMVNVTEFESLPVFESHIATAAVPASATAVADTTAFAFMLPDRVVASLAPFQVTVSEGLKFDPETVNVKLPDPAAATVGEIA